MSYRVANPKDRFSRDEAQITHSYWKIISVHAHEPFVLKYLLQERENILV